VNRLLRVIFAGVYALTLWPGVAAQAIPLSITNIAIIGGNPQLLIQSDQPQPKRLDGADEFGSDAKPV
jgi:hypothetical protein